MRRQLDCDGPVARALATAPRKPDLQFPQDENPQLAREGWAPRLWDYFYVSLTNELRMPAHERQRDENPSGCQREGRRIVACLSRRYTQTLGVRRDRGRHGPFAGPSHRRSE